MQFVLPPQEVERVLLLVRANDLETTVWDLGSFDCELFTTRSPIATGTVDLTNTGTLTRTDGSRAHFNGMSKCVWDGDDLQSLKCEDRINL
jgi:hypothetical protein